jgi:hypothetical protein
VLMVGSLAIPARSEWSGGGRAVGFESGWDAHLASTEAADDRPAGCCAPYSFEKYEPPLVADDSGGRETEAADEVERQIAV